MVMTRSSRNSSGKAVEDPGTEEATQPGDDDELEAIHRMDADNETDPYEALSLLACDLCDLADPLARDMIQSAFDEDLIDEDIVDRKTAWKIYDRGGETYQPNAPWLEEYSASYLEEQSARERLARTPQVQFPSRTSYPSFSPARDEAPPARSNRLNRFGTRHRRSAAMTRAGAVAERNTSAATWERMPRGDRLERRRNEVNLGFDAARPDR